MSGSVIAFDSCVFLAWFREEADKDLNCIKNLLQKLANGDFNLLVSAIVFAEVLDQAKTGSNAGTEFRKFVQRSNVIIGNVDMRIATLAAEMRESVVNAQHAGKLSKSLKAPDALIVATAQFYKAKELLTYDPVLIALSGTSHIRGLIAKKPDCGSDQREFDFGSND